MAQTLQTIKMHKCEITFIIVIVLTRCRCRLHTETEEIAAHKCNAIIMYRISSEYLFLFPALILLFGFDLMRENELNYTKLKLRLLFLIFSVTCDVRGVIQHVPYVLLHVAIAPNQWQERMQKWCYFACALSQPFRIIIVITSFKGQTDECTSERMHLLRHSSSVCQSNSEIKSFFFFRKSIFFFCHWFVVWWLQGARSSTQSLTNKLKITANKIWIPINNAIAQRWSLNISLLLLYFSRYRNTILYKMFRQMRQMRRTKLTRK